MTLSIARKLGLMMALLGVTMMARELGAVAGIKSTMAESALSLGFLMLFALLGGKISKLLGGPMITGFIVSGLVSGPFILGVVSNESAANLRLVDDLAFGVIAFYAGGEMRIERFRPKLKDIFYVISAMCLIVFPLVFIIIFPLFALTGILPGGLAVAAAGALAISVISVGNSPALVIGVINETGAKGPVSDIILGATVFKDVFVVMLFGLVMALIPAIAGSGMGGGEHGPWESLREITFSFAIGAVVGGLIILFFKVVEFDAAIFITGTALVLAEISQETGTSVMLSGIMAGFVVENFSTKGEQLLEGLRKSSMPVFALFFALAGQSVAIDTLSEVWVFATAVIAVRLLGMRTAVMAGLRFSGSGTAIARNAWMGFAGQAGLSLGLAIIIAKQYPAWGEMVKTIAVAVIVFNEIVGPLLMKRGLTLAGEIESGGEKTRT